MITYWTTNYSKLFGSTGSFEKIKNIVGKNATLSVKSSVEQIMSDVWDNVCRVYYWDGEKVVDVCVTAETISYEIDATPEVIEKVFNYYFERSFSETLKLRTSAQNVPRVGSVVIVKKGKVSKGVTGKVFKIINRPYTAGYKSQNLDKLGIALNDEMEDVMGNNGKTYNNYKNVAWVWSHNCEVMNKEPIDSQEVIDYAFRIAMQRLEEITKN